MPSSGNPSWQNSPSTATPITAAALNAIETALTNSVDKTAVNAKGDLLVGTANDTIARLGVGEDGQVLVANSAIATGMNWQTFSASTANSVDKTTFDAKGDLLVGTAGDAYSRLAVGSNGQYLLADSTQTNGLRWGTIAGSPTYGTTLPGGPVDGQVHILVDSTTSPTFVWHMRYNAYNTTGYKWEFIGGAPKYASDNGVSGTYSSSAYSVYPVSGGSFSTTLPATGHYRVTLSVRMYSGTQTLRTGIIVPWWSGDPYTPPPDDGWGSIFLTTGNTAGQAYGATGTVHGFVSGGAAGSYLWTYVRVPDNTSSLVFVNRRLSITPLYLGTT